MEKIRPYNFRVIMCTEPDRPKLTVVPPLDLYLFAANDFCWVVMKLTGLYCMPEGRPLSLKEHCEVQDAVDLAEKFADKCGLVSAKKQVTRIRAGSHLTRQADVKELKPLIAELLRRLQEDLSDIKLLHVSVDRTPFLDENVEALKPLQDPFPGAYDELISSRHSYALSLEQASVFHAMRALEIGLRALANHLGVPIEKPDWYPMIRDIETKIKEINDKPEKLTDALRARRTFLADTATNFRYFKDAWRNHVMHARRKYTDREAKKIMENVVNFMLNLAEQGLCGDFGIVTGDAP
jgi:HEPN domain-containing protein